MQLDLFAASDLAQLQEELFEAYFACRRNKRNTPSALAFERHFESRIFSLADEMFDGRWRPQPSTAFIVSKPVKREVFAAQFVDRVVHHWLMMKLERHFEGLFIEDSYACRSGKGTLFGIRRLESFIRAASAEHPRGCFVLKLDIRGFFMSIPRNRLWERLKPFIMEHYREQDLGRVLKVTERIVLLDAAEGCRVAGSLVDWRGLPPDKSLFHTDAGCGLPIGNLTSQVFANFYLHALDEFITEVLGFTRYGRYVDDFFIVEGSKRQLKNAVGRIEAFLARELSLKLHPNKQSLQHATKGVAFLGAVVWPSHTTVGKRIKGNFYAAIDEVNHDPALDAHVARQRLNSYLGIMRHHRSHRLRRRGLRVRLKCSARVHFRIARDCSRVRLRVA